MALEYFPCYHSYRRKIAKLSDQEVGRLFRSLLEYSETGETQELAGRESVAFDFIADDIDRAKEHYAEVAQRNSENGKLGGRPKNRNKAVGFLESEKSQTETKSKYKSDLEKESKKKKFTPPTIDEIRDYCAQRQNNVDPQKFYDYFEAADWTDSTGKPVKNWKQKVITWESREQKRVKAEKATDGIKTPKVTREDLEQRRRLVELMKSEED